MLKPGSGKTHRAYLWSHCSTTFGVVNGVVFDFAESRGGRHADALLGDGQGTRVCDVYSGCKALLRMGVTEAGGVARARRKFHELCSCHSSENAGDAIKLFGLLYALSYGSQKTAKISACWLLEDFQTATAFYSIDDHQTRRR